MAKKYFSDGTYRMWVRVKADTESALQHLAIDLGSRSAEVLGGELLDEAIRTRAKRKPAAKQRPPKR